MIPAHFSGHCESAILRTIFGAQSANYPHNVAKNPFAIGIWMPKIKNITL